MKTARPSVLVLALAGVAALPSTASAEGPPDKFEFFQTPSKRIGCLIINNASLRCDRPDRTPGPGRKPRTCEFDWGGAFGMEGRRRARRLCVSDTARDPKARILRYGRTIRRGPFRCTSRRTGLTCRNQSNRGWFISVQHTYLF